MSCGKSSESVSTISNSQPITSAFNDDHTYSKTLLTKTTSAPKCLSKLREQKIMSLLPIAKCYVKLSRYQLKSLPCSSEGKECLKKNMIPRIRIDKIKQEYEQDNKLKVDKDASNKVDSKSKMTPRRSTTKDHKKLADFFCSSSKTLEKERTGFRGFIKMEQKPLGNDHSGVDNLDSPVVRRKRKAVRVMSIGSDSEDDFKPSNNHKSSENPQKSSSPSPEKLAKKSSGLNNDSKMPDSSESVDMETKADLKSQFAVKKPSNVAKNEHKTPSPKKNNQEWKGPDFKLNLSPLGVNNHLDSWIKAQETSDIMSASPKPELDLQTHSQQLNDLYIDILEKYSSIFDKIPLKVLENFPEFDPTVVGNLKVLKENVGAKRIIMKKKIPQNQSLEHRRVKKTSSPSRQVLQNFLEHLPQALDPKKERRVQKFLGRMKKKRRHDVMRWLNSVTKNNGTDEIQSLEHQGSNETSEDSSCNLSKLDNTSELPVKQSQSPTADEIMAVPSSSTDSNQPELNKVGFTFEAPPIPTRTFVEDIINSGVTGEFDGFNYPFSDELRKIFKTKFHLSEFRPNQLQVINAVLTGHDCFVLMPTGSGKSLCYQLPALLSKGVTIVISPSERLAMDHVQKLNALDIKSCYLLEDISNVIYKDLIKDTPTIKLLYVTPEKFSLSMKFFNILQRLYRKNLIARFVIDEAHSVSQWGLDYELLEVYLSKKFAKVGITALTATASPTICQDVKLKLGLKDPKWFLESFNRPNLQYQVVDKKQLKCWDEVTELIKQKYPNSCGIVYCFSRKDCDICVDNLKINGINSASYHGDLEEIQRNEIQLKWNAETIKIVCATTAFGMDIYKSNVRFIIHTAIPKSIEDYYQESSRAGRDGDNADCILFYNYLDTVRMKKKIKSESTTEDSYTRQQQLDNLDMMMKFCENRIDCRRKLLLQHYGEVFDSSKCLANKSTTCNNCRNRVLKELEDQCHNFLTQSLTGLTESLNLHLSTMINPAAVRTMNHQMPNTHEEMLKIPHLVESILEKYGKTYLEIIAKYQEKATGVL